MYECIDEFIAKMNPNNINPAVIAISGLLCRHSAIAISAGNAVKTALQN